jgi:hypothetical protein
MSAFTDAYLERMTELHQEIEQALAGLPQEALDWLPAPGVNSIAILVTHIAGSERYWIGDVAVQEASGRDRDAEFRAAGLDEDSARARLAQSLAYARDALPRLPEGSYGLLRSAAYRGKPVTTMWALLHALEHLGIHLGHVQMVRQLWEQQAKD